MFEKTSCGTGICWINSARRVLPLLPAQAACAIEQDGRRTLFAEDYFCSYLFAVLNPVLTSMRALCHVSHGRKMRGVSRAPFSPAASPITPGHVCERKVLAQTVQPGAMIVADRHYGHDFALLAQGRAHEVDLVLRLYNNLVLEQIGPERSFDPGRPGRGSGV